MKKIIMVLMAMVLVVSILTAVGAEEKPLLPKQQQNQIAGILQAEFGQYGIVSVEFIPGPLISVECRVLGSAGKGIIFQINTNTRLVRVIDVKPYEPEILFGLVESIQNVLNPPASAELQPEKVKIE